MMSRGRGKMIVEFFSAEMVFRVCRKSTNIFLPLLLSAICIRNPIFNELPRKLTSRTQTFVGVKITSKAQTKERCFLCYYASFVQNSLYPGIYLISYSVLAPFMKYCDDYGVANHILLQNFHAHRNFTPPLNQNVLIVA